jgi:NitT/TauT family transport system ATP-binding protein
MSRSATIHDSPIVEASGLTKIYSGAGRNVLALQNVDFEIKDGEFICLVGPSGCGKSTLLKIVAGLLPYSEGELVDQVSGSTDRGRI